ncbi:hypothetical protein [Streptomyces albipurpureus]|uniref:Uncharacterized protein n=1 Tax=Streptomyces albipurpureus TaxID=2897419 RepID=A0ABT0UZ69_9ACTN|nr:hypothetical protein [Streptomyces sp. CWNU-1]MCM2393395.1 hypothetical protein [Streptomyces sp. CWNU-1]
MNDRIGPGGEVTHGEEEVIVVVRRPRDRKERVFAAAGDLFKERRYHNAPSRKSLCRSHHACFVPAFP